MPDDRYNEDELPSYQEGNDPPESEESDPSASSIFVQMMRQVAEQSYRPPDEQPGAVDDFTGPRTQAPEPPSEPSEQPLTPEELEARRKQRQSEIAQQRIQRVKRRKAQRRRRTVGTIGGFFRTLIIVLISAGLMATIFSWFTNASFLNPQTRTDLQVALATSQATVLPTAQETPNWLRKVGIVSGHRGPENDPGAVCDDGLTEASVNFNVAQLVVSNLRQIGYSAELLDEFDPRLDNYQAAALVSIHSNTCQDFPGEVVSGFLVAKAESRPEGGPDSRLAECLAQHYGQVSGLERRLTLTEDMTKYHSFREINPRTPAAIIELGFLRADRDLLVNQPDVLARGIVDGIQCFLEPAQYSPTPTPLTSDTDGGSVGGN